MSSPARTFRYLAALLSLALAGFTTAAQAQQSCGLSGISATAVPLVYDPFNTNAGSTANIVMNISRINPQGGGTTSVLNFYLYANSATGSTANGIQLVPISISGSAALTGTGLNIFYNTTDPVPTLLPITLAPTSANRFAKIAFTGNNAGSDTVQVTFQVVLPANLALNAVQNLSFDASFACNIQGGQQNGQTQTGIKGDAVTFPVTVLSALKTFYAGTALDFGEIGNVTTDSLSTSPKFTLDPGNSNYINVRSSGAYSVALTSANGFKLKRSGATTANDEVAYQLMFMGQSPSASAPTTFTTQTCARAGLTAAGENLPIKAKLLEGGSGKTPSPTYADILTVTITPLAYATVAPTQCGNF